MNENTLKAAIGGMDIYIVDQILKSLYHDEHSILDAGCGKGRNLRWFYHNGFDIHGIDRNDEFIAFAKAEFPKISKQLQRVSLSNLPYDNGRFDHVLCCAVLHFAKSEDEFTQMLNELLRVLKPGGSLLIRMASNIGLDGNAPTIVYKENGHSGTYYLTRERIDEILKSSELELLEPVKSTNVQDDRSMTTLVLGKK